MTSICPLLSVMCTRCDGNTLFYYRQSDRRIAIYCNDPMWRVRRTTSTTFLGSISAKLCTNTCACDISRHMVSHSRKVSIKGSNFPKNPLFYGTKSYPICGEATGYRKGSATPRLFPFPGGHPTDVPYLGDFCWGMYRFPAIHVRSHPKPQYKYESK